MLSHAPLASQLTPPHDEHSSSTTTTAAMSALESLPAMPHPHHHPAAAAAAAAAWQDPWGAAAAAAVAAAPMPGAEQHQHLQVHPPPHYMQQHQPQHLPHLHPAPDFYSSAPQLQQQPQQQPPSAPQQSSPPSSTAGGSAKEAMNSSSDSGSSGASSNSLEGGNNANKTKRTVNFKLEIKPEPEQQQQGEQQQRPLQKVPSISELSDPESSLDIPAQVSLAFFSRCVQTTSCSISPPFFRSARPLFLAFFTGNGFFRILFPPLGLSRNIGNRPCVKCYHSFSQLFSGERVALLVFSKKAKFFPPALL